MSKARHPSEVQARVLGDIVRLTGHGKIRNEHGFWFVTDRANGQVLEVADLDDADIRAKANTMTSLVKAGFLTLYRETRDGEEAASRGVPGARAEGDPLEWCGHYVVRADLALPSVTNAAEAGEALRRAEAANVAGRYDQAALALLHYALFRRDGGASAMVAFGADRVFESDEAARVMAEGLDVGPVLTNLLAASRRAASAQTR